MTFWKKQFPIGLAFVCGVVMFFRFFSPSHLANQTLTEFTDWDIIISGVASFLGVFSLLHNHYNKLKRKQPGWGYSVVVYVGFAATALAGFIFGVGVNTKVYEEGLIGVFMRAGLHHGQPPPTEGFTSMVNPFNWIFMNMMTSLGATMFALLAFYIASAAFRAFRAKTREATVLLIAALLVMIGRVPLWNFLNTVFEPVSSWIMNNPNMAAQRGIIFGIVLSQVALSLRIIFGIERTYMGGGD
jgi:hypothetical protein